MNEGKLRDEVSRGSQAEAVLRNPVFEEAFDALLSAYNNDLLNSEPDDIELREQCYVAIQMLRQLRMEIENVMQTGKMAQEELGASRLH